MKILHRPFFIRLFNWEYWSFNTVYYPIGIVWFYLGARAKSLFFFSAANPSILNGGYLMESKKAVYDIMPAEYYPKTILFRAGTNAREVLQKICQMQLQFPLIGKPDIGARGMGVKKLYNADEVAAYAKGSLIDFLVQEFVPFEKEVGIFYYRYPGSEKGSISGIVRKEFLKVTGDGMHTIRELCMKEKRFILQIRQLEITWGNLLDTVLPAGVEKELVPYGNHARGAKFLDDTHLADDELINTIDQVCRKVNGFYYGRLDIRFSSWEELKRGRNFSIIELNGAGSEPTHIYDPRHSLFFAWKEIIRHWIILWRISKLNHKKGNRYLTFKEGRQMLIENKICEKKLADQHV